MAGKGKGEKYKVAKGATLFSLHGPKDRTKAFKKLKKKKIPRNQKNDDFTIMVRGKDIENLDAVLSFLTNAGISVSSYKRKYLIRRTRARIIRLQLNSYIHYLEYLKNNPDEILILKETLSINVTRFFRNKDTFEFIQDNILPTFIRQNMNSSKVKIWSAGCAVGAEPYSISIMLQDKKYSKVSFMILATDINQDLLLTAQYGIYSPPYLAEMTKKMARKCFEYNLDGNYKIKSSIQDSIKFKILDLTKDTYPSNYDLVLCRNVLIYLKSSVQQIIIEKFYNTLKRNGILILGRTEILRGKWRKKFSIISSKHRIYRKI